MGPISEQIAENVAGIRRRIDDAAMRSGRTADAVTMIAVSKYLDADSPVLAGMIEAGCDRLGESRPQHLVEKAQRLREIEMPHEVRWHMIGHLQRNKVRKILPIVDLIHSADSPRIIEAIDRIAAEEQLPPVRVLLEVNISGEEAKHGFSPGGVARFVEEQASQYSNIEIQGLMCMAGLESDDAATRREFIALRELRDRLKQVAPDSVRLEHLSMGMSDDFEIAVEEGATIVRIGHLLFEHVDY